MQKFKLRSNDLDTLYSIFKHSSLTPLDIKQLRQNKFFYTYTPRRAVERKEFLLEWQILLTVQYCLIWQVETFYIFLRKLMIGMSGNDKK